MKLIPISILRNKNACKSFFTNGPETGRLTGITFVLDNYSSTFSRRTAIRVCTLVVAPQRARFY